jgi:hypothetical protein
MTYQRIVNMCSTTSPIIGAGSTNPTTAPDLTPVRDGGSINIYERLFYNLLLEFRIINFEKFKTFCHNFAHR